MSKLYPPIIGGTIPAFTGTTLVVPFSMNRAVSELEVEGFWLKIKEVNDNSLIGTIKAYDYDLTKCIAIFKLNMATSDSDAVVLEEDRRYKIQLAYSTSNMETNTGYEVGYYSTVGIVKKIKAPTLKLSGAGNGITLEDSSYLDSTKTNQHNFYYIAEYSNEDSSEKLYSTNFYLEDSYGNLVLDSGEIIHNCNLDVSATIGTEMFDANIDLEENKVYYIYYKVITSNGYETTSAKFPITQWRSLETIADIGIKAELNYEEGYVQLRTTASTNFSVVTGSFLITRRASNQSERWEQLGRFDLVNNYSDADVWRDYTIEQGVHYIYALQEYNKYGIYSERIKSNEIYADYEDIFLYDGKKQLKIRYNPKINSFKTNYAEQKIETLGSQFPFFYKNGYVKYKEFPIGGLVSYLMDNAQLFLTDEELFEQKQVNRKRKDTPAVERDDPLTLRSTDITSLNIAAERRFHMAVLDWLGDGNPKIFKSPTEGNYIVRLMNVSLTPTEKLGRMTYSFSATAYEYAEFNFTNLEKLGIINLSKPDTYVTNWRTIELKSVVETGFSQKNITSVKLEGVNYGQLFKITQNADSTINETNSSTFVVGHTGSFYYENLDGFDFEIGTSELGVCPYGFVTVSYNKEVFSTFSFYNSIRNVAIPIQQFTYDPNSTEHVVSKINKIISVKDGIQYFKCKLLKFQSLYFVKRPLYIRDYYNVTSPHYINIVDAMKDNSDSSTYSSISSEQYYTTRQRFLRTTYDDQYGIYKEIGNNKIEYYDNLTCQNIGGIGTDEDLYSFSITLANTERINSNESIGGERKFYLGDKGYYILDDNNLDISGIQLGAGVMLIASYLFQETEFQQEGYANVLSSYKIYLKQIENYRNKFLFVVPKASECQNLKGEYQYLKELLNEFEILQPTSTTNNINLIRQKYQYIYQDIWINLYREINTGGNLSQGISLSEAKQKVKEKIQSYTDRNIEYASLLFLYQLLSRTLDEFYKENIEIAYENYLNSLIEAIGEDIVLYDEGWGGGQI